MVSQVDPSFFIYNRANFRMYIFLHVDDMLITRNDDVEIQTILLQLSQRFAIKYLGLALTFLGIQIQKSN